MLAWFSSLNWMNIFLFASIFALVLIIIFRTIPNRRGLVWLVFVLPTCAMIGAYAWYWYYRREAMLALPLALVFYILFEGFIGHRLPAPSDKNIKVWGQED